MTAFFATCGMSMWKIGVAVILTAPRHIAVIFIGMSELQTGKSLGVCWFRMYLT